MTFLSVASMRNDVRKVWRLRFVLPQQLARIMNSVASGLPRQPMNQLLDVRSYHHSGVLLLFLLVLTVLIILVLYVYTTCFLRRKMNTAEPLPLHSDNGRYPSSLPILAYKFEGENSAAARRAVCWSSAKDERNGGGCGFHSWCIDAWLMSSSPWPVCQTPLVSAEESRDWGSETSKQMVEGNIVQDDGFAREASNLEAARTSLACNSQTPADDLHFSLLFSRISP